MQDVVLHFLSFILYYFWVFWTFKKEVTMTPEKRFARYAFSSLKSRGALGSITQEQVDKIEAMMGLNKINDNHRKILEEYFPEEYRAMYELAKSSGREPWSGRNVLDYWRKHHAGPSPVYKCRVYGLCSVAYCRVVIEIGRKGLIEAMINEYCLPLEVGDEVYVHELTIIEKA